MTTRLEKFDESILDTHCCDEKLIYADKLFIIRSYP